MKNILFILLAFLFFSCSKQALNPNDQDTWKTPETYTTHSIDSGKHSSSPISTQILWKNSFLSGYAYFDSSSIYHLPNVDSLDWNKLIGYKLDWNSVPNHASMVGWRYNQKNNTFEICPYFNNEGIVFPDEDQILKLELGEPFYYEVSLNGKNAYIRIENQYLEIYKEIELKKAWLYTSVSPWFGGTSKAPNDIKVYINQN